MQTPPLQTSGLNVVLLLQEHSYPFLKKVSKSEAPDYHEVISNPMDLATMTKNLHNLQYVTYIDVVVD